MKFLLSLLLLVGDLGQIEEVVDHKAFREQRFMMAHSFSQKFDGVVIVPQKDSTDVDFYLFKELATKELVCCDRIWHKPRFNEWYETLEFRWGDPPEIWMYDDECGIFRHLEFKWTIILIGDDNIYFDRKFGVGGLTDPPEELLIPDEAVLTEMKKAALKEKK